MPPEPGVSHWALQAYDTKAFPVKGCRVPPVPRALSPREKSELTSSPPELRAALGGTFRSPFLRREQG